MSRAVCFRCDWQGATRGRACPSCAAPLYRRPRVPEPFPAEDDRPERNDHPLRSLPPGASIGVALVLAVAVIAAIELFPGPDSAPRAAAGNDSPATRSPVRAGSLVYLAGSDGLWVVDLQAGGAGPGVSVPDGTRELVDLSGAGPGWIGFERARDGRRVSAAVIEGVGPDADVERLGHGDLVAWGPGGTSLVFARNGHAHGRGCAPVRINLVTVATRREQWALDDPGFCGPVLSLSRSSAATYFTSATGDRLSVYLTGAVGVPHLMFDGLGVLSAAPPSAFLLNAHSAQRTLDERPSRGGTLLGWKGIGGPITVGDGTDALTVERILSWSPDGSRVALVGALGEREGVFVLSAGAGTGPRVPRFVMPVGRTMDATFDASGGLYLAMDHRIFVDRGGVLTRVRLPGDAPTPAGPIVWIP
jgi:hypothetical protein